MPLYRPGGGRLRGAVGRGVRGGSGPGAAQGVRSPLRRRVLEQLLYHLGRWIYLVDAADDLKKDVKSGSYNPLVYRFHAEGGTLTADDKAALAATLDSSVRAMAAAFELADFGPWRAIIESVLYEGLYAVGAAVLNGTFRKGHKSRRRVKGVLPLQGVAPPDGVSRAPAVGREAFRLPG